MVSEEGEDTYNGERAALLLLGLLRKSHSANERVQTLRTRRPAAAAGAVEALVTKAAAAACQGAWRLRAVGDMRCGVVRRRQCGSIW
jgi:hypothetical protein